MEQRINVNTTFRVNVSMKRWTVICLRVTPADRFAQYCVASAVGFESTTGQNFLQVIRSVGTEHAQGCYCGSRPILNLALKVCFTTPRLDKPLKSPPASSRPNAKSRAASSPKWKKCSAMLLEVNSIWCEQLCRAFEPGWFARRYSRKWCTGSFSINGLRWWRFL